MLFGVSSSTSTPARAGPSSRPRDSGTDGRPASASAPEQAYTTAYRCGASQETHPALGVTGTNSSRAPEIS
ncbi:hypothetical protein GCM10010246_61850 [Streptomyces cuspidosporus]|uniref:Uncharacterized protein n=1 Tax=Streptomyces cuspidosporus TaxID=66882 RepID=A0ABP5TWG2_9ACTN